MIDHTFVITAYKNSPHLEECILSLIAQNVKSKIILTTSTPSEYIKGLADKYQLDYIINQGASSSIATDWNFGLSQVNTTLATIAHQDDLYHPDYLFSIIEKFKRYNSLTPLIIFTNYTDLIHGKEKVFSLNHFVKNVLLTPFLFTGRLKKKFLKKSILVFGNPICCPSVTINLKATNNFRFSEHHNFVLDWYAWLSISKMRGVVIYISKRLVQHRIHEESETTNQTASGKRITEELNLLQTIWGKTLAQLIGKIYMLGHKGNKF